MSREDVEFVRRSYANTNPAQAFELFHSDAVWDMSTFTGWTEDREYVGPEEILRFHTDWLASFSAWGFEVVDVVDAGSRVVGIIRQQGIGKGSGANVDMTVAQVWTIREGKFERMQMYADPAEALAALGVDAPASSEQPNAPA